MMEVSGRLSEDDLDDVAHLLRSRWYWPRLLLESWHGLLLIGGIIWLTVSGALGQTNPSWIAMGVIWVVILGIVVWTVVSVRRERVTDLTWLNQTLPETITLDAKGATWRVSGEQVTLRWADVKGWRERDRVVSLDGPAGPVIMIPMANLSESERHALRNLLRAVVPRARH